MAGMHHVELRGRRPDYPRGGLQLRHIELLLAMLTLCNLELLIEPRHPYLPVGQHGLPAHDDQQGNNHHDDRQVLDQTTAGAISAT